MDDLTRGLFLTSDLGEFVDGLLARGRYPAFVAVVCEALTLLKDREALRDFHLARLHRQIQPGITNSKTDEGVSWEETKRSLQKVLFESPSLFSSDYQLEEQLLEQLKVDPLKLSPTEQGEFKTSLLAMIETLRRKPA